MPIREKGDEVERDHDRDRDRERRRRSRSRERGSERTSERGSERTSERGSERTSERGSERTSERTSERGSERRERRKSRSRSRSRSRSPKRRRSSPGHGASTTGPSGKHEEPPMSTMTEEERQMKELLGFGCFHSTKGKKVEGNNVGAVHVIMKRKYRQYMNRKGGFNRPLDFVA